VLLNCPLPHPSLHSFPTRRSSDLFSAESFVCCSVIVCCLFSPSGYGYGCDCNVIVSCELTSSAVEPILSPAQWLLRQKADQLHELGRALQAVDGSRLDRSIAAQLPLGFCLRPRRSLSRRLTGP